jgi:hypothetical protein
MRGKDLRPRVVFVDCISVRTRLFGGTGSEGPERLDELRGELVELAGMIVRERAQNAASGGGETQDNHASVSGCAATGNEAEVFAAIAELDDAVMAQGEAIGEIADGSEGSARGSRNLKHELVLLRSEAGVGRGFLTEVEKTPEDMAEFSERLKTRCRRLQCIA